jgi:hypothetical protein
VLVWAAPARGDLISALGARDLFGGVAVTYGAWCCCPLLRGRARLRDLLLPTHFLGSMWVGSRIAEDRAGAAHRVLQPLGQLHGHSGDVRIRRLYAAGLPPLLAGTLLFLTPMSFLVSTARNAQRWWTNSRWCSARHRPVLTYWRSSRPDGPSAAHDRLRSPACAGTDERRRRRTVALIWC